MLYNKCGDSMFWNKKNSLILLFLLTLCLLFTKIGINESNDTFYLIKLGELITKNGIDLKDHFSWINGLSYTYPHWLYSIIIYYFYYFLSYKGLFLLNFISYSTFIITIYYVNLKINKNTFIAFLVSLISIFTLKIFIVPRSIAFSGIIFFLEVFFIHQLIEKGQKKYILYLFLLSILLANIHATSWIMFFILFLPFFAEAFISKIKHKKWNIEDKIEIEKKININYLLIAFVLAFLAGLISPSRICYTYVFKIMQGNSQIFISEHAPLDIIKIPIVLIFLFLLFFSKSRIKLHEFFMIAGLTLMTFSSYRHIIFFYTIVLLYLSIIFLRNINMNSKNIYTINFFDKLLSNKLLVGMMIIVVISSQNIIKKNMNEKLDEKMYPINALNYINDNKAKFEKDFFNEYDYGSYLLFNNIKVFVDSRCDLYLKEFNSGIEILNDYFDILEHYNFDYYLEKYNIKTVLLNKKNIYNALIKYDSKYNVLYEDDNYIIYERNSNEKI